MATNSFGLDAAYFSDKLSLVLRDLSHFTPEELARALARMARTACEGVLGEAEFTVQAAPTCAAQDGDAQLDAMRRSGLSIDGDNAYKRDLIDCIVGALMLGKQGVNPPPAGHWLEQFWQTARGEGEIQEQLAAAPAVPELEGDDLTVWRITLPSGEQCHFGTESMARAWGRGEGKVERVDLKVRPRLEVVHTPSAAGTASVEDGSIAKTALAEQPDTVKVRDLLKRYFDALDRFDREGPVSLVVAAAKEADALEKELRALLAGGAE